MEPSVQTPKSRSQCSNDKAQRNDCPRLVMTDKRMARVRGRQGSLGSFVAPFKLGVLSCTLIALGPSALGSLRVKQEPVPQEQDSTQEQTAPPTPKPFELLPPGKRRAIQGMGSVVGLSKVTFPSQPGVQQDLECSYAFPDRARWRMTPSSDEAEGKQQGRNGMRSRPQGRTARHQMFRFGNGGWTILPGNDTSEQHEGEALRIHMLRFELRRLALIWPGELTWTSEENSQRVVLEGLGKLEVQLDPATQRPILMRSIDPDGSVREEFKNIQWNAPDEERKRFEPASWDLHFQGTHVWTETFLRFTWGGRLTEAFFQPNDRFQGGRMKASGSSDAERLEIPEVAVWREDLNPEAKTDWDQAIQQARQAMERWRPILEEGGFMLDEYPVFRLSKDGDPLRLELRLKDLPDYPPEGWFAQGGLDGLRRMGVGLDLASKNSVISLRGRTPSGHISMDPYLAVQLLENGVGITQLVMPIALAR